MLPQEGLDGLLDVPGAEPGIHVEEIDGHGSAEIPEEIFQLFLVVPIVLVPVMRCEADMIESIRFSPAELRPEVHLFVVAHPVDVLEKVLHGRIAQLEGDEKMVQFVIMLPDAVLDQSDGRTAREAEGFDGGGVTHSEDMPPVAIGQVV